MSKFYQNVTKALKDAQRLLTDKKPVPDYSSRPPPFRALYKNKLTLL